MDIEKKLEILKAAFLSHIRRETTFGVRLMSKHITWGIRSPLENHNMLTDAKYQAEVFRGLIAL
jgi:hypothetical protein